MSQLENTAIDTTKKRWTRDPDELGLQSVPYRFLNLKPEDLDEETEDEETTEEDSFLR